MWFNKLVYEPDKWNGPKMLNFYQAKKAAQSTMGWADELIFTYFCAFLEFK